jgi:hypothetical protein
MQNAYKILMRKAEGDRPHRRHSVGGRITLK